MTGLIDTLRLDGRTALIVGGAGLLGGQISDALAEMGAHIIIASRDREKCLEFIKDLRRKHQQLQADAVAVDLRDKGSIERMAREVDRLTSGSLNVMVNAGWSGKKNTLESITIDDWQYDIDISLTGTFLVTNACLPMLKKTAGNVLLIASMYGHVAPDHRVYAGDDRLANPPSYGAAKAGVIQLTKYFASFLSPHGIRVNAIVPFSIRKHKKEFPILLSVLKQNVPEDLETLKIFVVRQHCFARMPGLTSPAKIFVLTAVGRSGD